MSAECIADTLVWHPTHVKMPTMSSADAIMAAAKDLTITLNNLSPATPLAPISNTMRLALTELTNIFTAQLMMPPAMTPDVPPGFQPQNATLANPPVTHINHTPPRVVPLDPIPVIIVLVPRVEVEGDKDGIPPRVEKDMNLTYVTVTGNAQQ